MRLRDSFDRRPTPSGFPQIALAHYPKASCIRPSRSPDVDACESRSRDARGRLPVLLDVLLDGILGHPNLQHLVADLVPMIKTELQDGLAAMKFFYDTIRFVDALVRFRIRVDLGIEDARLVRGSVIRRELLEPVRVQLLHELVLDHFLAIEHGLDVLA